MFINIKYSVKIVKINNIANDIAANITKVIGANLGVNWTKTKIRIPKAIAVKEVQKSATWNP